MADSKPRSTGAVYRDEAADLMMAAATRNPSRAEPPELELTARRAAPVVQPESKRPLPYPEPVGINDNADDLQPSQAPHRRVSVGRRLAWIVIAPLYLVIAVASFGIIALFARGLLGY